MQLYTSVPPQVNIKVDTFDSVNINLQNYLYIQNTWSSLFFKTNWLNYLKVCPGSEAKSAQYNSLSADKSGCTST